MASDGAFAFSAAPPPPTSAPVPPGAAGAADAPTGAPPAAGRAGWDLNAIGDSRPRKSRVVGSSSATPPAPSHRHPLSIELDLRLPSRLPRLMRRSRCRLLLPNVRLVTGRALGRPVAFGHLAGGGMPTVEALGDRSRGGLGRE